ncbi:MAG TPA: biosynthetic peptidoglycan transglycosylase [bacterium]|jgi:monofunctional biosynthetic peptidoglycan transglycosylase|nr:biosynthetic peptidoglycan transglycosylase [bacterium]
MVRALGRVWVLVACGVLAALALWQLFSLPDTRPLRDSAWMERRFGLSGWTPLKDCSKAAVRAILLSEDDTFYRNDGLRLDAVGSAAWDDLVHLRYRRGASSLTQQVVKNAFLGKQKTLMRKGREMLLAQRADRLVDKETLLEDYLNLAEWGPHHERGIAWASRAYFQCSPAELSARDGALLAWLLPDPGGRSRLLLKGRLPASAKRHVKELLARMRAGGAISADELAAEEALPYPFERGSAPPGGGRGDAE